MTNKKNKKKKSIFRKLSIPMCVLIFIETGIILSSLIDGGIFTQLNQNAKDILNEKVINRCTYLENEMTNNWSNIEGLCKYINSKAEQMDAAGDIDLDFVDSTSESATPLLVEIVDQMILSMRTNRVTGVYVVLNNDNLDSGLMDKPGIYIKDKDPASKASSENYDLLMYRAPTQVVEKTNIAMDSSWTPSFQFKKDEIQYYDFLYIPYQGALNNEKDIELSDLGYWGGTYTLNKLNIKSITYSLPLISSKGKVYGVVGVDIDISYLEQLLPSTELNRSSNGSYLLASMNGASNSAKKILCNGATYLPQRDELKLSNETNSYINDENRKMFCSTQKLNLYNTNAPYSDQEWVLVGIVDNQDLFFTTYLMVIVLSIAAVIAIFVGIIGSLSTSYFISKPISKLSEEVENFNEKGDIKLKRTNISEIDNLASKMEKLNKNIINNAMKFSNILKMSSVQMAGFEYNKITKELFISDNFFEVFLESDVESDKLTEQEFKDKFDYYKHYIVSTENDKNDVLFKIPDNDKYIYINMRRVEKEDVITGVVENVTNSIVEKKVIEYERDHDILTSLLNRRAYKRVMAELFNYKKQSIKKAALVMFDLDNLKYINDNYGHEQGDTYISIASSIFVENTPDTTIISRVSGDEFYVFIYGYEEEEDIREIIDKIACAFEKSVISFPNGNSISVNASGGIAWYPKDSENLKELEHYADYAMYKVKHSSKGRIVDFDMKDYLADYVIREGKDALNSLIETGQIQQYFQPIVDAHDGSIYGYESLMRSGIAMIANPVELLKIAKQEGRLAEIERLTWLKSLESYDKHYRDGYIKRGQKIFINSIPNQRLKSSVIEKMESEYSEYLENIVLEVIEEGIVDKKCQQHKEEYLNKWKAQLALDDYGNGYNGDVVLLSLSPDYVKIDREIINEINLNENKCKIVENMVNYAHGRGIKVIAEGIETIDELKKVIELKVDYLQGFVLAKPQYYPPSIADDLVMLIKALNQ